MNQPPPTEEEIKKMEALEVFKKKWLPLICDLADTMTEVIPEPTEIVPGLVCEQSKVCIGGSSKTNKTWLAQDMALSISTGTEFLGRKCLRRRVLYINLELKDKGFKRRLQTIAHHKNLPYDREDFRHMSLKGKIAGMAVWQLIDMVITAAQQVKAEVVVLDPIYKLNVEGDENSSRDQTVFFNQVDRITTEASCAVIYCDHFGKGSQAEKDPLDAIRGSSAKGGDVDAALVLRKHQQEGSVCVDVVHREIAPVPPFVITWHYPIFEVDASLDAADKKQPIPKGRPKSLDPAMLLAHIYDRTEENPISIASWAELAGVPRKTLSQYLPTLRSRGWIRTLGDGNNARQFITSDGISFLSVNDSI